MAELEGSPLADLVVDVGLSVEQVQELLLTDPNDLPQYVWDEDGDAELFQVPDPDLRVPSSADHPMTNKVSQQNGRCSDPSDSTRLPSSAGTSPLQSTSSNSSCSSYDFMSIPDSVFDDLDCSDAEMENFQDVYDEEDEGIDVNMYEHQQGRKRERTHSGSEQSSSTTGHFFENVNTDREGGDDVPPMVRTDLSANTNLYRDISKSPVKGDIYPESKRPKNGFIRFSIKYRKVVASSHPNLDNREISRILGSKWRKLSHEDKKPYEDEFFDEMEERKRSNPFWKYGGVRKKLRSDLVEPIPSRLRPRDRLKRKEIPRLTRPYRRRKIVQPVMLQWNWVQCDLCNKWRKLPFGTDISQIPDNWYCQLNPDPFHNCCDTEEEVEEKVVTRPVFEHQVAPAAYSDQEVVMTRPAFGHQMAPEVYCDEEVVMRSHFEHQLAPEAYRDEKVVVMSRFKHQVAPTAFSDEEVMTKPAEHQLMQAAYDDKEVITKSAFEHQQVAPAALCEEEFLMLPLKHQAAPVANSHEKVVTKPAFELQVAPAAYSEEVVEIRPAFGHQMTRMPFTHQVETVAYSDEETRPAFKCQGSPAAYSDEETRPAVKCQVSPETYRDEEVRSAFERQGSPAAYSDEEVRSAFERQGSPAAYSDEEVMTRPEHHIEFLYGEEEERAWIAPSIADHQCDVPSNTYMDNLHLPSEEDMMMDQSRYGWYVLGAGTETDWNMQAERAGEDCAGAGDMCTVEEELVTHMDTLHACYVREELGDGLSQLSL